MLFFNFLCLLYLMVLVNSHTLSKSIVKDDETINVVDNVHDFENVNEHEVKPRRHRHKNKFHEETTKFNKEDQAEMFSTFDNENITVRIKDESEKTSLLSTCQPKGFFRRLIDKMKKKKSKHHAKNETAEKKKVIAQQHGNTSHNKDKTNCTKVSDSSHSTTMQRNKNHRYKRYSIKHENPTTQTVVVYDDLLNYSSINTNNNFYMTSGDVFIENYTIGPNYQLNLVQPFHSIVKNSTSYGLADMDNEIRYLKQIYGITPHSYTKFLSILRDAHYNYDIDQILKHSKSKKGFGEIVQIEALLDKMKSKAFHIVTESLQTANSFLETVPQSTNAIPSQPVSAKDPFTSTTHNYYKTQSALPMDSDVSTFQTNFKRKVLTTTTNNRVTLEDIKNVYEEMKSQVSKEIAESENNLRDETKRWPDKYEKNKLAKQTEHKTTKGAYTVGYERIKGDVGSNLQSNIKKLSTSCQNDKSKYVTSYPDSTLLTNDDYAILSEYDQFVDKIQKEKFKRMISDEGNLNHYNVNNTKFQGKTDIPFKGNRNESNYDAGYVDNNEQSKRSTHKTEYSPTELDAYAKSTTMFKELVQKLYYKDYVNGYKHYLKFQKELGRERYSNLVRYQAHKHHNVDDIGKFILDKLPRVPERLKRAFYDDSATTEDQDISTKNEESWFKRHFYVFIDSGRAKKFHSLQTVPLRPSETESDKIQFSQKNFATRNKNTKTTHYNNKKTKEFDLDKLGRALGKHKSTTIHKMQSRQVYEEAEDGGGKFESVINKPYTRDIWRLAEESEDNYDATGQKFKIDKLPKDVLQRSKRSANIANVDDEFQFYSGYVPKDDLRNVNQPQTMTSTPFDRNHKKYGYVNIDVVPKSTAVRNISPENKITTFFQRLRSRFHKKSSSNKVKSSKVQKRSTRLVRSLNPLKKLRKMFNKTGSKFFDYEVYEKNVNPYASSNYKGLIDNGVTKISKSKESSFDTTSLEKNLLAKKYYQHTPNPVHPANNKMLIAKNSETDYEHREMWVEGNTKAKQSTTKNKVDSVHFDVINTPFKMTRTTKNYNTRDANDIVGIPSIIPEGEMDNFDYPLARNNSYMEHEAVEKDNINTKDIVINKHKVFNNPFKAFHLFTRMALIKENTPINNADNNNIAKEDIQVSERVVKDLNREEKSRDKLTSTANKQSSASRQYYQTTPDFFKDLEIWHNDILNSEKFTSWQKILNTIKQPLQYRPPDVTTLEEELNTMRKHTSSNSSFKENVNSSVTENAIKINSSKAKTKVIKPVYSTARDYEVNDYLRDVPNDIRKTKNRHNNLSAKRIAGFGYRKFLLPNAFFTHSTQYDETENRDGFQGSTLFMYANPVPEVTQAMVTTLLAYDDNLEFTTGRNYRKKEKSTMSSNNTLHSGNLLTKLHKAPKQYFSTPLPMKTTDFYNFLKENDMDMEYLTTPLDFPGITDKAIPTNEKFYEARLADYSKATSEAVYDYFQKYNLYKLFAMKNEPETTTETTIVSTPFQIKEEPHQGEGVKNDKKPSSVPSVNRKNDEETVKSDHDNTRKTVHKAFIESKTKNLKTGALVKPTKESVKKNVKTYLKPSSTEQHTGPTNIKHNNLLFNMPDYKNERINELTPTRTLNYDAHNIKNRENTVHTNLYSNFGLYSKKPNEPPNDSEDERVKELVRVVEVVANYTQPSVLIHIDLPTFYRPDRNLTDSIPCPATFAPKSIWSDFVLKYLSGIALIELLSKFGIIKAVEANLTDGTERDVNAYGVFSGALEPRLEMDLTPGDAIVRIGRSLKELPVSTPEKVLQSHFSIDNNTTAETTPKTTTEPLRHATIIYDLRQLGRPREAKLRRGHSKEKIFVKKEYATTTNRMDIKNGTTSEDDVFKDGEDTELYQETNLTTNSSTKWLGTSETIANQQLHLFDEESQSSENALGVVRTTTSKRRHSTRGRQQMTIITTKFYSDAKIKANRSKETSLSHMQLSGMENKSSYAKFYKTLVDPQTTTIRKVSSTAKTNAIGTDISYVLTMFDPSVIDTTTPLDEASLYITNYYDYEPIDFEYNNGKGLLKNEQNETEMKDDVSIKHDKRDTKLQDTFTAKNVAAIEIIVDLMRNKHRPEESDAVEKTTKTRAEASITLASNSSEATTTVNDIIGNSIQVHIAIPCNESNDKKRSLNDPVRIRKVFTAKLFTPVDMEYQIHSVEGLDSLSTEHEITTLIPSPSTTRATTSDMINIDALTSVMYILVENKNTSVSNGNYILKPVYNNSTLSDRKITETVTKYITKKGAINKPTNDLANVTFSKEFIAAINRHLLDLYQNVSSSLQKIKARNLSENKIPNTEKSKLLAHRRKTRHLDWEAIKKYFGHDKVCSCHCKPNHTMCRACAASDAVISEIIFELDNLAQYMNDHCTEIQTYFWMNPSGGRKLRDAVHKIDKTLYDYYKRARGKCKGRPCKTLTYIEKRDFLSPDKKANYIGDPLIRDIEKIADDLELATKYNISDEELFYTGTKCIDIITKCMHLKPFNKRADEGKKRVTNVYSLDNVNVNIICKSDTTELPENSIYPSTILSTLLPTYSTETPSIFYYDTGEYKIDEKKKKGFRSFLSFKKYHTKKKRMYNKNINTYPDIPSGEYLASHNQKLNKRQIISNNQIDSPFTNDNYGLFWYNRRNNNKYTKQSAVRSYYKNYDIQQNGEKDVLKNWGKSNYTPHYSTKIYVEPNLEFDRNANELPNHVSDKISVSKRIIPDSKKHFKGSNIPGKESINSEVALNTQQIKNFPNILRLDKFEQMYKPPFAIDKIETNQNKQKNIFSARSLLEKTNKRRNRKVDRNNSAFSKSTKKITSVIPAKKTKLVKSDSSQKEQSTNLEASSHQCFISRMKEATLKFLDKLDGTDNFLIDDKTTPFYTYGKSRSSKHPVRNPFWEGSNIYDETNIKNNDILPNQVVDANLVKSLKRGINYYENSAINNVNNAVVPNTNNNKELLLSILDFETNKLNDEWERVASKKSVKHDFHNDVDDVDEAIFQLEPEVLMIEKTTIAKENHGLTTASNPGSINIRIKDRSINTKSLSPYDNETKIENKVKTDRDCGFDNYYDIRQDLRDVELKVPPELATTKVYNGLLDNIIHKFAIKVVPSHRTDKDFSKGRSLKRKTLYGNREHDLRHRKVNSTIQNTTVVDTYHSQTLPSAVASTTSHVTTTPKEAKSKNIRQGSGHRVTKNRPQLVKMNVTKQPTHQTTAKTTRNTKPEIEEVYESSRGPSSICDIDATLTHIENEYKRMTKFDFGLYVKNITCYKYRHPPSVFLIKAKFESKKKGRYHGKSEETSKPRWSWIRSKRSRGSLNGFKQIKDVSEMDYDDDYDDNVDFENHLVNSPHALNSDWGDYESLYLGGDGVYRVKENERKKRKAVDMSNVVSSLTNLPPLRPLVDEVFVLRGDSITIQCNISGSSLFTCNNVTDLNRYNWSAERRSMLKRWNVNIIGPTVSITHVDPNNFGTYTCYQKNILMRNVRLNIIEIPTFNIVFTPLYKCHGKCSYEDLENIQQLDSLMAKTMKNSDGDNSFRIDYPVCLSNKDPDNFLKPTAVIIPSSPLLINCDAECQRDLSCSLALLWATNVPVLSNIKVLLMYDKLNKTLIPDSIGSSSSDLEVIKTLKWRDSNGHREYRRLSTTMQPGDVAVVVACPAGYYLMADPKICVVCPANTCSSTGENACSACPRGTHSEPGAATCRIGIGLQHSDNPLQWLFDSWQWCVAVCFVGCTGYSVAWLSVRRRNQQAPTHPTVVTAGPLIVRRRSSSGRRWPPRPLSPSRVLLERLFRHSPSSSRATNSQETRLGTWKEKNVPPPLPPIDFDYW